MSVDKSPMTMGMKSWAELSAGSCPFMYRVRDPEQDRLDRVNHEHHL